MQLNSFNCSLFKLLYITAAAIVICQILDKNEIASAFFAFSFCIVFVLWLSSVFNCVNVLDVIIILIIIISFLNIIINASIYGAKLSFGYLRKFIMFGFTLIYFQVASKLKINKSVESIIFKLNSFLALFFIICYFLGSEQMYYINGIPSNYLTFRFTNPNLTAQFLTCICMMELLHFFRQEKVSLKTIHLLLGLFMFYFLLKTESRTSLIALVIISVFAVILYFRRRYMTITKGGAAIAAVFPLLVAIVYLIVMKTELLQGIFSFLQINGKSLNTRVYIWNYALSYFEHSPVLGAYADISNGSGISQMHNIYIDILASYGIVICILVCYFIYKLIMGDGRSNSKYIVALKLCFMCMLFAGVGEAALFSGGLGIYIYAGAFLLLNNVVTNTDNGEIAE